MNKKDLWLKRQYVASRGAVPRRRSTPYIKDKHRRRETLPKWAKWGDQSQYGIPTVGYMDKQRFTNLDEGHEAMKRSSVLNHNYRRSLHPIKDKRKYWNKAKRRKREGL